MKEKKSIVILGAGISGLSLAWYLQNLVSDYKIVILEKSHRAGGWIETNFFKGMLFEKAPRIFKVSKSKELLSIIDDLEIEKQIICSSDSAKNRYIYFKKALRKLPTNPFSMFCSPLTRPLLQALLTEWKKPFVSFDESIYEFACRRFNKKVAERLFDPMALAIFGGDSKQLSIQSCFPLLKEWEKDYGSVLKGFWNFLREKKTKNKLNSGRLSSSKLFSLQGGTQTLIDVLVRKLQSSSCDILYKQTVKGLTVRDEKILVDTQDQSFIADYVFCGLPLEETKAIFSSLNSEISSALSKIPSVDLTIVQVGFRDEVMNWKSFGYLVPSIEKLSLLGVVFDSLAFPEHNRQKKETRLTFMLAGAHWEEKQAFEEVHRYLKEHLKIASIPDLSFCLKAKSAIPQYHVGHNQLVKQILRKTKHALPNIFLTGNYLEGAGVNDCIRLAKKIVENFKAHFNCSL